MNRVFIILAIVLLSLGTILEAQWDEGSPSCKDTLELYEDMFGGDEPLNLTLKFNLRSFRRTRADEEYHLAEMTCQHTDSFSVTHPVRVKARGIYRRDNCTMPPFWLNIRYSGIGADELSGIRRMKVVTRCRDSKQYEDYVLREYLVYKIYNLITPYSYRVRLVRLKYEDTGRDNRESQCWGFLIEPDEVMARRLHGKFVKSDVLSMRNMNRQIMDRLAMFQYMIGNGDYSVTGRHNLRIMSVSGAGMAGFVPVPYDFDYTGFVNAQYAIPGEALGISSIRERYFLGPCRSRNVYLLAIHEMELLREEIDDLIWSFDYLDEDSRFDLIGYIESFFNTAANERFIERNISTTCR